MEVVPITLPKNNRANGSVGMPFNRRNVEEWSKLDRLTGIMETAKIETNHWAAKTLNATHNYGKVVDARERNNADGSLQERQKKQMEVFQTKVAGGSMQVIRTQTITTSSKKWSSMTNKLFDDLALPINSLDLSSQKTKGSVGRSGSIGGRRPPTRPRSLISQSSVGDNIFEKEESAFGLTNHFHQNYDFFRKNVPGKSRDDEISDKESESSGVVITDVTNEFFRDENSRKTGLSRQKSSSNENLNDENNLLKRYSKVRRSLQCHKQNLEHVENDSTDDQDSTPTKSLKERAAEIEKLLRRGNTSQFSPVFDKFPEVYGKVKFLETKDAFVSADTLKEVRERLKKPLLKDVGEPKDDGIVTEKNDFANADETYYKKPGFNGTGSLESKYSNKSSSHASRTSEWFKRRKSYGFEQVDEYGKFDRINGKKKNYLDSSTDSGICQSSETMGIPVWTKTSDSVWTKIGSNLTPKKDDIQSNIVNVRVKEDPSMDLFNDKKINSIYLSGNEDPFPIKKEEKIKNSFYKYDRDLSPSKTVWNQKSPIPFQKNNETFKSSLKPTKNPWLSQLRGTKLVDRDWASDEWTTLDDIKCDALQTQFRPTAVNEKREDLNEDFGNLKKNKKVEFCKTEVHFAAESGKFNIVETDGKPPPNDCYRRRKKSGMSGGSSAMKDTNGLPEIKFGDSPLEKNIMKKPEKVESISEKIEAELNELSKIVIEALPRTEKRADNFEAYKCKNSLLYDVAEERNVDNKDTDLSKPRSILKNYGNPFELDEIKKPKESTYNELPQKSEVPVWQSTVVLRNKRFDDIKKTNDDNRKLYSSDGESELQIRIRNLRKTDPEQNKKFLEATSFGGISNWRSDSKRRSLPDDAFLRVKHHNGRGCNDNGVHHDDSVTPEETYTLSVAERIKKVEQLKLNNYSTKINFRSGQMTIVQNGTSNANETTNEDKNKPMTSWENQKKMENLKKSKNEEKTNEKEHVLSSDELLNGNGAVTRFSTYADDSDKQKYQTTRILINFKTSLNKNEKTNEPTINEAMPQSDMSNNAIDNRDNIPINSSGSWPSGSTKKDLKKYLNELKSANMVRETIHPVQSENSEPVQSHQQQRENIPKPSKTVHEIIDQFDSLSRSTLKEKRRKSILTKTSKEYTHSDLEEELKNFTENLDKDFRDIYEEEIGTFRKSKSLRETKTKNQTVTPRVEDFVRPVNIRSSYSEPSSIKPSRKHINKIFSKTNYDSDDSDLLADEEVRSYMSTGHGKSDSDAEGSDTRKSFQNSVFRLKKMGTQTIEKKDIKYDFNGCNLHNSDIYSKSNLTKNFQKINKDREKSPKRASIVLKYQDHSQISKPIYQNVKNLKLDSLKETNTGINKVNTKSWTETKDLNSTTTSTSKPRERVSYLNGLSLSEKYSNYLQRSSDSSVDMVSDSPVRRNSHENFLSASDDNFSKKNKNDISKPKMTTSAYLKQYSTEEKASENQKKEKCVEEKPIRNKYVPKTEYQEDFRRRQIKTNPHKLSDSYQIRENGGRLEPVKRERNQTDGDLEEMRKAAEEIIMAVNGFTDDSSHTGTSEDERSKRIFRKDHIGSLGTISESKQAIKTETKKTISLHSHGRITGNRSSASSTESLNKESFRSVRESKTFARHKHGGSGTGICSRASRSFHRVTKEAATGQQSSSEDNPSCVEQVKRRVVRRQKNVVSSKPEVTSEPKKTYSRHRSKSRGKESPSASMKKNSKQNKLKESSSISKSSRTSQIFNDDKTKSASPRKIATNKPDFEVDSNKKRRSQRIASKEEHLPLDKAMNQLKILIADKVSENKSYKKKMSSSRTEAPKLRQATR